MVLLHLRILNSRHSVPTWIIHSSAGISLGTTKAALEVDLILLYLKICFFSFFFFLKICFLKEMCSDYFVGPQRTEVGLLESTESSMLPQYKILHPQIRTLYKWNELFHEVMIFRSLKGFEPGPWWPCPELLQSWRGCAAWPLRSLQRWDSVILFNHSLIPMRHCSFVFSKASIW